MAFACFRRLVSKTERDIKLRKRERTRDAWERDPTQVSRVSLTSASQRHSCRAIKLDRIRLTNYFKLANLSRKTFHCTHSYICIRNSQACSYMQRRFYIEVACTRLHL